MFAQPSLHLGRVPLQHDAGPTRSLGCHHVHARKTSLLMSLLVRMQVGKLEAARGLGLLHTAGTAAVGGGASSSPFRAATGPGGAGAAGGEGGESSAEAARRFAAQQEELSAAREELAALRRAQAGLCAEEQSESHCIALAACPLLGAQCWDDRRSPQVFISLPQGSR